jgi:twitching motility protein PilJ
VEKGRKMSDPKQNYDANEINPEDFSSDDLQDLYDDADLPDLDDLDDFDVPEAPVEADAKKDSTKSSGKFWLVLGILAFLLAILVQLLLVPAVTVQEQRSDNGVEAVSKVNVIGFASTQALNQNGRFEPVAAAVENAQEAIDRLVQEPGISGKVAESLFGNSALDESVIESWADYKSAAESFLANDKDVTDVKQKVFALNGRVGRAVGDSVVFVESVAKEGRNKGTGAAKDKYLFLTSEAANLNGILGRFGSGTRGYFAPDSNLAQLSDAQNGLIVRLQETLDRIVSNSAEIVGTSAEPLRAQYADLESRSLEIGDRSSALQDARDSMNALRTKGADLSNQIQQAANQSSMVRLIKNLSSILPLLLAALGAFALWRYSQAQAQGMVKYDAGLEETLADQQESILKLLDEMSALADGDLTVEAEVTDQITGAIADSVNFAIIEMRELVLQINRASIEVANESEQAVSNAQSVSQSNIAQSEQIAEASTLMEQVSSGMRNMSEQANSSATMASESLKAATQGAQAVRDTIEGMENMREQIQDTSKRIKRLGESSQRIGDIVALIDDIAEQTNILSLNAAIQASMAGEAGRGFAVVSDEVQSLAERSTEATKKIAELVTTIQNDTNDAVLSMEKATQQVVSGTKVADSAGGALVEIETVSQQLSTLVQAISTGSNEQAERVIKVSEQVAQVSDSSTDTSRKAQESANSIAKLLELAKDLETSVSRFKLPSN